MKINIEYIRMTINKKYFILLCCLLVLLANLYRILNCCELFYKKRMKSALFGVLVNNSVRSGQIAFAVSIVGTILVA